MVYFCLGVILVWQCFSLVLCCMVFSWDCFRTIYTAFTVKQTAPLLTSTHRAMIHKRYVMHTYFVGHLMKFSRRSILYHFHTALPHYLFQLPVPGSQIVALGDTKMKGKRKYKCVIWEKGAVAGKRKGAIIDLIHDSRHLWTRFRIGEIKAMSRGISGANKRENLPIREIALDFVYSLKMKRRFNGQSMQNVVWFSKKLTSLLLAVRTSTVAAASEKVKMITSTYNLPLLSLIEKVINVLFSRINKLDRDFLYWKNLSLVCPQRNHVTSLLSHQSLSACKYAGCGE